MTSSVTPSSAPDFQDFNEACEDALAVAEDAEQMVIQDSAQYVIAAVMLGALSTRVKELDALRMSMTRPLDESKQRIIAMFKPIKATLADARAGLQQSIVNYDAVEQAKRESVAASAREAAEAHRQELFEEAAAAHADKDVDSAEQLLAMAAAVPEPVAPRAPHRKAAYEQIRWSAEVTDFPALVQAVAAGRVPIDVLSADQPSLNRHAVARKSNLDWPGVRAVGTRVLGASSR